MERITVVINASIEKALNDQINAELYSSYLYYSMANYLEQLSLSGAAHWMRVQALEEMSHVSKLASYLNDRQGKVVLAAIAAPPTEWNTLLELFEETYSHETEVTALINSLLDLAIANSDHATVNLLQWFVSEQVEEEASADAIVQKLKLIDNAKSGLFMLDKELAARPFVLPPELTA